MNTQVAIATAKGVVTAYDATLLTENSGHIDLTNTWAKRLLGRMGLVKAKVTLVDYEEKNILSVVYMGDIPGDLIINWEHTGIKYIPVSNWIFEKEGTKRVETVRCDDKRQHTALLSCMLSGKILLVQVIYAGKTPACLPKIAPPESCNMIFMRNHWANEETMQLLVYLQTILLPYMQQKRSELGLVNNHPALVI